jgi:hypothetical protein
LCEARKGKSDAVVFIELKALYHNFVKSGQIIFATQFPALASPIRVKPVAHQEERIQIDQIINSGIIWYRCVSTHRERFSALLFKKINLW